MGPGRLLASPSEAKAELRVALQIRLVARVWRAARLVAGTEVAPAGSTRATAVREAGRRKAVAVRAGGVWILAAPVWLTLVDAEPTNARQRARAQVVLGTPAGVELVDGRSHQAGASVLAWETDPNPGNQVASFKVHPGTRQAGEAAGVPREVAVLRSGKKKAKRLAGAFADRVQFAELRGAADPAGVDIVAGPTDRERPDGQAEAGVAGSILSLVHTTGLPKVAQRARHELALSVDAVVARNAVLVCRTRFTVPAVQASDARASARAGTATGGPVRANLRTASARCPRASRAGARRA
jgi:hypothetical protein